MRPVPDLATVVARHLRSDGLTTEAATCDTPHRPQVLVAVEPQDDSTGPRTQGRRQHRTKKLAPSNCARCVYERQHRAPDTSRKIRPQISEPRSRSQQWPARRVCR